MGDISTWANTAGGNDTGSTPDYPVEGMAPSSVNDTMREMMAAVRRQTEDGEWFNWGDVATFASATSFTVPGDVTSRYQVNRRVRAVGSLTGTIYGLITASSFSASTTVTVTWDSGSLNSEVLTISLGTLSGNNPALDYRVVSGLVAQLALALPLAGGSMTGSLNEARGSDVASATSTNIWATDGNTIHVTGTTTITSFGTAPQAGARRMVVFDGALTLTNGANLILPGGADITTAAGDVAEVLAETTTQHRVTAFTQAVVPPVAGESKAWVNFNGTGTVAIRNSFNVASITDNGTGAITVNIDADMANSDYAVALGGTQTESGGSASSYGLQDHSRAVGSFQIRCPNAGTTNAASLGDWQTVSAIVFGDQ